MQRVASSNVHSIGYDPETMEMQVRFNNGGTYIYYDVPEDVYKMTKGAKSVGGYLHDNVKDYYDYSRTSALRRAGRRVAAALDTDDDESLDEDDFVVA